MRRPRASQSEALATAYRIVTWTPGSTFFPRSSAFQFESRMQPWLVVRPIVSGTSVPWMPLPFVIQLHPENADGIVRAGREIEEVSAPFVVLEHRFIPAKGRHPEKPLTNHSPIGAGSDFEPGVIG